MNIEVTKVLQIIRTAAADCAAQNNTLARDELLDAAGMISDLLEQFKLVLPLLEGINKRCTQDTAMIASVRAAIAKATGGAA